MNSAKTANLALRVPSRSPRLPIRRARCRVNSPEFPSSTPWLRLQGLDFSTETVAAGVSSRFFLAALASQGGARHSTTRRMAFQSESCRPADSTAGPAASFHSVATRIAGAAGQSHPRRADAGPANYHRAPEVCEKTGRRKPAAAPRPDALESRRTQVSVVGRACSPSPANDAFPELPERRKWGPVREEGPKDGYCGSQSPR